jgi:two-component system response regulator AgrA
LNLYIYSQNKKCASFLYNVIKNYTTSQGISLDIKCFSDSTSKLLSTLDKHSPNAFFIDITSDINDPGYDLALYISKAYPSSYIVLTSEDLKNVFKSFHVKAFDFLQNEAPLKVVLELLERLCFEIKDSCSCKPETFLIKKGAVEYLVYKSDIEFVEKSINSIVVNTLSDTISSYGTLSEIEKTLSTHSNFIRCHRSFIVNLDHIKHVNLKTNQITLFSDKNCFIGKSYRNKFIDQYHTKSS